MTRPLVAALLTAGLAAGSCDLAPASPQSGNPEPRAAAKLPAHPAQVEGIAGYLTSRTDLGPDASRGLARTLVSEARAHGFEPALVLGLIQVESTFRPDAVSSAGAVGLMQIRPATGRYLAKQMRMPWAGRETLLDPEANVRLGIAYLAELRDGFGNLGAALAAYNWGPSRIRSRLTRGAGLPQGYARRVLDAYADHGPRLGASS